MLPDPLVLHILPFMEDSHHLDLFASIPEEEYMRRHWKASDPLSDLGTLGPWRVPVRLWTTADGKRGPVSHPFARDAPAASGTRTPKPIRWLTSEREDLKSLLALPDR